MTVIFFARKGFGEQLQAAIEDRFSDIEVYRTLRELTDRLRQPFTDSIVTVLSAANRQDIVELLSIRDLLQDIRTILILPDRAPETITKGHRLHPRLLSYVDVDFTEIIAVLEKMLQPRHSAKINTKRFSPAI